MEEGGERGSREEDGEGGWKRGRREEGGRREKEMACTQVYVMVSPPGLRSLHGELFISMALIAMKSANSSAK